MKTYLKTILYSVAVIFVLFVLNVLAFSQVTIQRKEKFDWEKVIPLITTKDEVEKYFGKPKEEDIQISAVFNTEFGIILIFYNGAKQPDDQKCKFNVSSDTVYSMSISLTTRLLVSNLDIDFSKYEKNITHLERYVYTNKQKGISFVVDPTERGEEIVMIYYTPSCENIKRFCIKK